jgi:hypothetical protein
MEESLCYFFFSGAESSLRSCKLCSHSRTSPAFYGTRRLVTVFTRAIHWSLSWARSIQSIASHLISPRSILILSTHLRLSVSSGLFPYGFPTNILYAYLLSSFVLLALSTSSSLTWSLCLYLENRTSLCYFLRIFWLYLLIYLKVLCISILFYLMTLFSERILSNRSYSLRYNRNMKFIPKKVLSSTAHLSLSTTLRCKPLHSALCT